MHGAEFIQTRDTKEIRYLSVNIYLLAGICQIFNVTKKIKFQVGK